jgi:hypothetical protein
MAAGRLAAALAVARAVVHVIAARGAFRARPRVRGGVDREPQPRPAGAGLPDESGILRGHPGQRVLQQPAVDHVMVRDPFPGLRAVHGLRQRLRQQREEPLIVDLPLGQRAVQGAVTAAELRLQAQRHQRRHRVISAQDRVAQLEQRILPRRQALIQPRAELPQPFQRPVPGGRAGEHRRIRSRDGLPQPLRAWQGSSHGRFLSVVDVSQHPA